MARDRLRHLVESVLGARGRALLAWRTRGQAEALLAQRGLTRPAAALAARLRDTVQRGPFAGLHYPRRRGDIVHAAKLLGAYESELHAAIDSLLDRAPALVVNVGSGDGFYVVGCARRLPEARIVAVDPDPLAQRACADTARLNAVAGRIEQVDRLDAAGLDARLRAGLGRALCLVDCEGYEDELLDPTRAPALRDADLLVETHDFARPGVTARLTERFRGSHRVEGIAVSARDVRVWPELTAATPTVASGLLDEFRHMPQSWLVCTSRSA